jgi:hypothetical protein
MIIGYKYDHLDPAEIMFIDGQGELFADPHCVFSLRDVFVRQQKMEHIVDFRQKLLLTILI